jgi:FkbM family methyltransferase
MLNAVWKPWYVYRPHQLARRLASSFAAPPRGHRLMPVSWGMRLWADPTEHVGRSLWTTGVFDLAVSEVLFRLTERGDLVIDAGANIGYMTLLAAVRSGPGGRVVAFEPNPHVARWLMQNIEAAGQEYAIAAVEVRTCALGSESGTAHLVLPDSSAANEGLARIASLEDVIRDGDSVPVPVERLDDVIGNRTVGLMKVDVEGHEEHVLRGAASLLGSHRIRHIVFEEHHGPGSPAMKMLSAAGYEIFAIGWSMRGPVLAPAADGSRASAFEAPSYLATTESRKALDVCRAAGWQTLQRRSQPLEETVSA